MTSHENSIGPIQDNHRHYSDNKIISNKTEKQSRIVIQSNSDCKKYITESTIIEPTIHNIIPSGAALVPKLSGFPIITTPGSSTSTTARSTPHFAAATTSSRIRSIRSNTSELSDKQFQHSKLSSGTNRQLSHRSLNSTRSSLQVQGASTTRSYVGTSRSSVASRGRTSIPIRLTSRRPTTASINENGTVSEHVINEQTTKQNLSDNHHDKLPPVSSTFLKNQNTLSNKDSVEMAYEITSVEPLLINKENQTEDSLLYLTSLETLRTHNHPMCQICHNTLSTTIVQHPCHMLRLSDTLTHSYPRQNYTQCPSEFYDNKLQTTENDNIIPNASSQTDNNKHLKHTIEPSLVIEHPSIKKLQSMCVQHIIIPSQLTELLPHDEMSNSIGQYDRSVTIQTQHDASIQTSETESFYNDQQLHIKEKKDSSPLLIPYKRQNILTYSQSSPLHDQYQQKYNRWDIPYPESNPPPFFKKRSLSPVSLQSDDISSSCSSPWRQMAHEDCRITTRQVKKTNNSQMCPTQWSTNWIDQESHSHHTHVKKMLLPLSSTPLDKCQIQINESNETFIQPSTRLLCRTPCFNYATHRPKSYHLSRTTVHVLEILCSSLLQQTRFTQTTKKLSITDVQIIATHSPDHDEFISLGFGEEDTPAITPCSSCPNPFKIASTAICRVMHLGIQVALWFTTSTHR